MALAATEGEAEDLAIDALPDELLMRCFNALPLRDRAVAACVSTDWRFALASPLAWRDLDFSLGTSHGGCRVTPVTEAAFYSCCRRAQGQMRTLNLAQQGVNLRPSSLLNVLRMNHHLRIVRATELRFPWSGAQIQAALTMAKEMHTLESKAYLTVEGGETSASLLAAIKSGRFECKELHVAGRIRVDALAALADAMAGGSRLRMLHLAFSDVNDDGAAVLGRGLAAARGLRSLNLRANNISAVGARTLATALSTNAGLESLVLGSNRVGDEGMASFAAALKKNTSLVFLDVSGNSITEDGALSLASSLLANTTLQHINLDFNSIGATGVAALAAVLPRCGVTSLDLEWNGIRCAGATCLAYTISLPGSRIRRLGLASNGICAGGATICAGALRNNRSLEELILNNNPRMGPDGVGCLAAALAAEACSLKRLELAGCCIDEATMFIVAASLSLSRLEALNIGENATVGSAATVALAHAVRRNETIRELSFSIVPQSEELGHVAEVTLLREANSAWRGVPSSKVHLFH